MSNDEVEELKVLYSECFATFGALVLSIQEKDTKGISLCISKFLEMQENVPSFFEETIIKIMNGGIDEPDSKIH